MNKNNIKLMISLLTKVSKEKIKPEEALKSWPEEPESKLINIAWHNLSHYECDEDIRKKDKDYDIWQKKTLIDNAKKLKEEYDIK